MEGPFRLLLVVGLLAALLPAAAATFGPQPGSPCRPTLLATNVSLFCAPDMPTAQCCEQVVAAVDLGGGLACLFRVAAEPQLVMAGLNATHLLTIYTSCGRLRPGGAHLATACEGPVAPAAVISAPPLSPEPPRKQPHEAPPLPPSTTEKPSPPPEQHDGALHSYEAMSPLAPAAAMSLDLAASCEDSAALAFKQQHGGGGQSPVGHTSAAGTRRKLIQSCDPFLLAGMLADSCGDTVYPSTTCCKFVRTAIDQDCLCQVIELPEFIEAGMVVRQMWSLYSSCRGARPIPTDRSECSSRSTPPPPPPNPSPPHSPQESPPVKHSEADKNMEKLMERLFHLTTQATIWSYMGIGFLLLVSAGLVATIWKLRAGPASVNKLGDREGDLQLVPLGEDPSPVQGTLRRSNEILHSEDPQPSHQEKIPPPQMKTQAEAYEAARPSAPPMPLDMLES